MPVDESFFIAQSSKSAPSPLPSLQWVSAHTTRNECPASVRWTRSGWSAMSSRAKRTAPAAVLPIGHSPVNGTTTPSWKTWHVMYDRDHMTHNATRARVGELRRKKAWKRWAAIAAQRLAASSYRDERMKLLLWILYILYCVGRDCLIPIFWGNLSFICSHLSL